MGRGWKRKARKAFRNRRLRASHTNEGIGGAAAGCSGNCGNNQLLAGAPADAAAVVPISGHDFSSRHAEGASIYSGTNAVSASSGKIRLLRRAEVPAKGGGLLARAQAGEESVEDFRKYSKIRGSAVQRVDVAKLIKDDLEAYTLRTSQEILSAFLSKKSSIGQLFSSYSLDTAEPPFHEMVLAAFDRVIRDLFFGFRQECLNVLTVLTKSTYFASLAGSYYTLANLSARSRCQLVLLLSLTVQEKIMSLEQVRHYLNELETSVYEKCSGGDVSGEAVDQRAVKRAEDLLNWEEQSLSFHAERERALRVARRSVNKGPQCASQEVQLTEQEYERLSRGHRASASLLPSNFELRYGSAPELSANRLDGRYRDVDEYIDTHFFLLRENFIGPLRKAVQEFVQLSNQAAAAGAEPPVRLKNARLYGQVIVVRSSPVPGQFTFKVRLSHGLVRSWSGDRLLIKGSLVVLSADMFETIILATVVRKDPPEHGFGNLVVDIIRGLSIVVRAFARGQSDRQGEATFSMIESATYYEEYRHNSETLQRMEKDTLPFRHHLITESSEGHRVTTDCESGSAPRDWQSCFIPGYLMPNALGRPFFSRKYDFSCVLSTGIDPTLAHRYQSVDVLDSSQWPTPEHIGLDVSQADALRTALCSDLAVIQGPPGTGKTYIGIKIVSMLLANSRAWSDDKPAGSSSTRSHSHNVIAVICYTNHALDQFLELILDRHPDSVVRIGGRSSNPRLDSCNIKRLSSDFSQSRPYRAIKRQLDAVERLIAAAETRGGAGSSMKRLTLKEVSRYLETRHSEQFRGFDDWSRWLDCDDIMKHSSGFVCEECSEQDSSETDVAVEPSAVALCKHLIQTFNARVEESRMSPLKMTCPEMLAVDNVWNLPMDDRWRMYRYLTELYWQGHSSELEALAEQRNNFLVQLKKLNAIESLSAFRGRKIIGATVTGAIKHRILMNLLKPKVVIVEEAAEILEANILASFTRHCEHLILIGDHQQLRPKPEYELSVRYRLDVSLFERLVVHRGMIFTQLQIQRRMRPEISKIVRKIFYNDQLQDHESVEERESVRGLARNVFFVQHTQRETSDAVTKTFVNEFEARFAVELCRYLLHHGYERRQVTILVPYGGQRRKILELLGPSLQDVHLTTIDNYQGEENDIIILCLVRSSDDGTIGFVGESNRICVALSRARLGFFCFGNFNLLSKKSPKWKAIVKLLTESGEIGAALPLYCYVHGQKTGEARAPEDMSNISNGGCSAPCNAKLLCGHFCQESCHYDDPSHQKRRKCRQKCLKLCRRGQHDCEMKCSDACDKCYKSVLRTFAECGHQWEVRCFMYDIDVCMHPVTKCRVRCGHHKVDSTCHFSRCTDLGCSKPGWLQYAGLPVMRGKCYWLQSKPCLADDVFKYPGCGHQIVVSCHALTCTNTTQCSKSIFTSLDGRRETVLCKRFSRINCPFQLEVTLQCGHSVRAACSELRHGSKVILCTVTVVKICDLCGNEREVACGISLSQSDCKGLVNKTLACGHTHRVECGKQKRALICTQLVKEKRPTCGHCTLERRCCDDPASITKPCTEVVDISLACKHTSQVLCSSDRERTVLCARSIVERLNCGHNFSRLCHDTQNRRMCQEPVKVERKTCIHHEIVFCHEKEKTLPACSQQVEVKLPSCGHSVSKPCSVPIEGVLCERLETRRLGCGHKKRLKCYEVVEDAICLKLAARRSPCRHAANVSCHALSCKAVQCGILIRLAVYGFPEIQRLCHEIRNLCTVKKLHQLVLCGHQVEGDCSAKLEDLVCATHVYFGLPCGHHVLTNCHVVQCQAQGGCNQTVSEDDKSCTTLKSELAVCTREAKMELPCGHKVVVACHVARCEDVGCQKLITWRDEGTPCHCLRAAALATDCREKDEIKLPCGHRKSIECCEFKECRCNQSSIASEPNASSLDNGVVIASPSTCFCQMHACSGYKILKLNCGHTAKVPCRDRLLPVYCSQPVEDIVSLCGHSAQRTCGDRTYSNLKCTSEHCEMWCWHGGCQKRCAELCEPCTEPCVHCSDDRGADGSGGDCGHFQTTFDRRRRWRHLCFQPCPIAPCPMPCNRPLPCGHECLGLCGEPCPALCLACHGPLLERVCRRYNVGPTARFLRLMPCNDVVPVAHMDALVASYRQLTGSTNGDTLLMPLLCPSCRSPVGYCRRYEQELKRYFNLKRKVPIGENSEWIGCSRGHVRRREEQYCGTCAQLSHRTGADPTGRRLQVGIPVRFRRLPGALTVQPTGRPMDELIGEVYSFCNNDDDDDAAELVVKVGGKFVVTVAGNVTAYI